MQASEVMDLLMANIDSRQDRHYWCWHMQNLARGEVTAFVAGLTRAVGEVDDAAPGFASEMARRLGSIRELGDANYHALMAACAEIYVALGMVQVADQESKFEVEPGKRTAKKAEFVSTAAGIDYAVEVKTPNLVAFGRERQKADLQYNARLPQPIEMPGAQVVWPRDNPVKDFLASAQQKFQTYRETKPHAVTLLFIVWNDYCQEAISALLSPSSGLLTSNSFHRIDNHAVVYPDIDGIVVSRYQLALSQAMADKPLPDDEGIPFRYHGVSFPPKVLIQNPYGRKVPADLTDALSLSPIEGWAAIAAEYTPGELVFWLPVPD